MSIRSVVLAALLWPFFASFAMADSVILVHGYLGSAGSWRGSGVVPVLQRRGLIDAGHLRQGPRGVYRQGPKLSASAVAHRVFTIDLPSEAPVAFQANMLARYIAFVRSKFPRQLVVLVGHSAGGVVGRFTMVTQRRARVRVLITIASPHLGTAAADLGSAVSNSPFSLFAPMFGAGTVNRSRELYNDLSRERPGNLLGWLNRQPHPVADYVSIIRVSDRRNPQAGDSFVDGFSQDMNSVLALRGRSKRIFSLGEHGLNFSDGHLIANILTQPARR